MLEKQSLQKKIERLAIQELHLSISAYKAMSIPFIEYRIKQSPILTIGLALLKFLLFVLENLFDQEGKFQISLLKILPTIKAVKILINDIINAS